MLYGRGRDWFGRGFWKWGSYGAGPGGFGGGAYGRPFGGGRGRGNPYPFCRCFPGLPRGWWWTRSFEGVQGLTGMSGEDELGILRQQEAALAAQLEQIKQRVSSLEGQGGEA